jgi:four helix bundle protein
VVAINRFEDLDAWRKSRELTRAVYRISGQGDFRRDFALCDQIRRATVSVLSNIAEGHERGGDKEFRQFHSQAKGSAGELKSQLYVALDAGLLSALEFEEIYGLADEVSRLIGGLMRYLAESSLRGAKFR